MNKEDDVYNVYCGSAEDYFEAYQRQRQLEKENKNG